MDDRRDDIDDWLHARIDPLPPPPGTFELIKRRARRRRYRQVAVSAVAAAAVAAAVIVVPHLATSVLQINQKQQGSDISAGSSASPSAGGRGTMGTSTPVPSGSGSPSSAASRPAVVPIDFAATSATFVSLQTGWVIGQAGVPGNCSTQYCTSVARTDNAGQTWYGVPAPLTGAPDGASGVGQIRFLDRSDGWAFGPQLFATNDGGEHWTQVPTGGQRVIDLETVGNRAFAIFATCSGTGSSFAAQCTSFTLYSTVAGSDDWAPVPGVSGLASDGGSASASVVLTSSQGYLLAPDGTLYTGPVDGSGSWQQVTSSPAGATLCAPGAPQQNGQPSRESLAAATASDLVLLCALPAAPGGVALYTSADGGQAWQQGNGISGVAATAVAAQPGGEIIMATNDGLEVTNNGGASWQQVESGAAGPPGGFSWVGMTSTGQGVALPADPSQYAVWFTFTSGQSWQRSPITGP